MKGLMRSAEFARLCGTTKATLRHYAQLGLLEPCEIADNGYRMYAPEQMAVFATISALQDAGFSLKEIVCLGFGEVDQAETRRRLEQQSACMEQRIAELQRRHALLVDAADVLSVRREDARCERTDVPEALFAVTRIGDVSDFDSAARAVAEHARLRERMGLGRAPELFTTYRIDAEAFKSGHLNRGFSILSACPACMGASFDDCHVARRPAGVHVRRMFSIASEDSAQEFFAVLEQAAHDLHNSGIATAGDVYLRELPGMPLLSPTSLSFWLSVALK